MEGKTVFFKPDECRFMAIAVIGMLTDLQETEIINWTPQARKQRKEMIEAGIALKIKLAKLGVDMRPMDPYAPGDEDEFLTKQS